MSQTRSKSTAYYENAAVVLTYHDINPSVRANSPYSLTPNLFGEHLEALKEYGFQFIHMESFRMFMKQGTRIPPNAVLITFDDGEKSFYAYAYPELRKRYIPAVNFILGKKTDAGRGLSWDQMREMKQTGFGFYSHTYDLHRNTNYGEDKRLLTHPLFLENENRLESKSEYERRIREDLTLMEKRIGEELGPQPKMLSFPFGSYNDKVIEIGRSIGMELFFTVARGLNASGQMLVKRINAGDGSLSAEGLLKEILHYVNRNGG